MYMYIDGGLFSLKNLELWERIGKEMTIELYFLVMVVVVVGWI